MKEETIETLKSFEHMQKGDTVVIKGEELQIKYVMCRYGRCPDYPYGWVSVIFKNKTKSGAYGIQGNFNQKLIIK